MKRVCCFEVCLIEIVKAIMSKAKTEEMSNAVRSLWQFVRHVWSFQNKTRGSGFDHSGFMHSVTFNSLSNLPLEAMVGRVQLAFD